MNVLSSAELCQILEANFGKISNDFHLLPEINNSNYDALPFIEIWQNVYYYVCLEREVEVFRKQTTDLNELVYMVMENLTFKMSWDWAKLQSNLNTDLRISAFAKQVELMGTINLEYGHRLNAGLQNIIKF